MSDSASNTAVKSELAQLDALLGTIDSLPDPALRDRMSQIVQALLAFHGQGLARILDGLESPAIDRLIDDELVISLLLVHGLHPLDLPQRIERALVKCRPYLASHGGHVELVGIGDDGAVNLRLEGSCHHCPSSRVTLQGIIEEAIRANAPEITDIRVEGLVEEAPAPSPSGGFIPLSQLAINGSQLLAAAG